MGVTNFNIKNRPTLEKAFNNYREGAKPFLKDQIKRNFRIQDEVNFIKRFKWINLPSGLDGQMVERMLYYKYQLAMFYVETLDEFFLLPFTLKGNIDVYGRWNDIIPLPYQGGSLDDKGKQKPWIEGLSKKVLKELPLNITYNDMIDKCVILRDYTLQMGQEGIARSLLQDPIIDYEAEIVAMQRTALMNSTGVAALRVGDESEVSNVYALNDIVQRASLNGDKYVATVGQLEFQNLDTNASKQQDFMQALQNIDNLRLTFLGVSNGGVAEKQGTVLQAEMVAGNINTGDVLQDGLDNRQEFCLMCNALWGTQIWCEIEQDFDVMQEINEQMQPELEDEEDVSSNGDSNTSDFDSPDSD